MKPPKNYALRSGAYQGLLLSLEHDVDIHRLLDYDKVKHATFVSILQALTKKAEEICENFESQ